MVTDGYQSSIRVDSHASNYTTSAAGCCNGFRQSVCHIPNSRRTIARPRDDRPPVRRESERVDHMGVTLEYFADPLLGDVPNLQKSFYVEHSPQKL